MRVDTKKSDNGYLPLRDESAFRKRLRSRRHVVKSFEAKANKRRNLVEKGADLMTSHLGSMEFLVFNFWLFVVWIVLNTGVIPGIVAFDHFPFGLLTMIVSLEAIFLSIVVLISQNRASRVDDLRQEIDLQINTIAEEEITKMMELQVMLLKKHGIDLSKDEELCEMLEPADPDKIEKALERQI